MAKKVKKAPPPSHRCCCDYNCMHVAEYPVDIFFFFLQNCCLLCCHGTHCCTNLFMVCRAIVGIAMTLASFYFTAYDFSQRWTIFAASFVVLFIGLTGFVAYARATFLRPEEFQHRHKFSLVVKVFEVVFAIGTAILLYFNVVDNYLTILQWVVVGVDLVLNPIEIIATFVVLSNLNKVSDVEKN